MDIKFENNSSSNSSTQSIWLYEETLTMIDFVKSNAYLYDRKDAGYNQNQKKNSAWQKISEILNNKSPKECKRKWSTLRIQQRRILLQNIARKRKCVQWQFYEPLQFLIPHMEMNVNTDSTRSNYSDDSETDETETSYMESDSKNFQLCQMNPSNTEGTNLDLIGTSVNNQVILSYPNDHQQQQQHYLQSEHSDNAHKSIVVSKADTISHSHENQCLYHKSDSNFISLNYFLMDVQLQMGKLNEFAQMELKIEIQKMILEKLRNPENLKND